MKNRRLGKQMILSVHILRKAYVSLHFGICTKLFEGDRLSPIIRTAEKAMLLEVFGLLPVPIQRSVGRLLRIQVPNLFP